MIPAAITSCLSSLKKIKKQNWPMCKFYSHWSDNAHSLSSGSRWQRHVEAANCCSKLCSSSKTARASETHTANFPRVSRPLTFASATTGRSHCQSRDAVRVAASHIPPGNRKKKRQVQLTSKKKNTVAINCLGHK